MTSQYDYASITATATRLISRFGRLVTLRKKVRLSGANWKPVYENSDQEIYAVSLGITKDDSNDKFEYSEGMKYYLNSSVEIDPSDKIIDNGVEYAIEKLKQIKPGPDNIVYIATVSV